MSALTIYAIIAVPLCLWLFIRAFREPHAGKRHDVRLHSIDCPYCAERSAYVLLAPHAHRDRPDPCARLADAAVREQEAS